MGEISEARTAYPLDHPRSLVFSQVHVAQMLDFYVVFCGMLVF